MRFIKFKIKKIILLVLITATIFTGNIWGVNPTVNGAENQTKQPNQSSHSSQSEDYIAFYAENPMYRINGKEKQIDANNKKVAPYLKNGNVFIPVRVIAEAFGGSIQWDAAKNTAVIKDKNKKNIFSITAGSNVINMDGAIKAVKNKIQMDAKSELREGRLYAPASSLAEAFGKSCFYERGLIIITDKKYLPDSKKDKSKIDALIADFTGIINVGTKKKLVELLGYDPTEPPVPNRPMYGGEDMLVNDDSIIMPTMEAMMPAPATEAPLMAAESVAADKPAGIEYSETNVQVQGVDEADIIKTDGRYIYYVRNQAIEIVKVNTDGSFEWMSSFKLPTENSLNFNEIFIDNNRIIAIGTYYKNNSGYVMAVVINAENKKTPKLERSVEVKGNYATSRKIGNSVYFVANQYFWYWYGNEIMPTYRDTAVVSPNSSYSSNSPKSSEMIEIGYDRLHCFPIINGNNITVLVGFNIDKPNEEAFIETFLGCGEHIYMSGKAMYIASASYSDKSNETIINKFAVDNGKFVFVKSGKAPGTVLNQFSMDEYQSYFRIVTNVYDYKKNKEYNGLYVFDNTLQIAGRIDDIAPGEHIYSARFMGKRAFMVTFKTVDPLFAIDLTNPEKPVVMGALKIPGYSNYLHPYDENHLIGFGKDTVVDSYNNAFYTGMKISLFDVTDITNPIEMFVETIGARGTDSALLNNHKALLFSKEKNLLAFPVTVYESDEKAVDGKMPSYGTFAFSGAYVYDIDLKNGFSLRGKLSHLSGQDMLKSSDWGGNPDLYIQRLLTIQDKLYAASNGKLTSHNLNTIKPIDELIFKDR